MTTEAHFAACEFNTIGYHTTISDSRVGRLASGEMRGAHGLGHYVTLPIPGPGSA